MKTLILIALSILIMPPAFAALWINDIIETRKARK